MHERGGPEVLRYQDVPDPTPVAGEVLVRVRAATVNHTDLFHRSGRFFIQKELPHVLGMDLAGEIAALGPDVTGWAVGDRVVATFEDLGRKRDGAYAELATVPVSELRRIPNGLDFNTAASVGLAFTTAWVALRQRARIGACVDGLRGERVVVTAAASGVGTAAVQIAAWLDARVVALVGDDESDLGRRKAELLKGLGADAVLRADDPELVAKAHAALGGEATLVVEHVAGASLQRSLDVLGPYGRIVCIGTLGGDVGPVNVMDMIMKNATVLGSFGAVPPGDFERILGLFAMGVFEPVIDRVMPLAQAREAHELVEARQTVGKVLLVP
ncbi:MAG: NADPH:quinone reductase [Cyanobacteria bacterium RYN_339]|nr:NADPH:quinone reductase [Cyanobacteria bacterium RYN_339]